MKKYTKRVFAYRLWTIPGTLFHLNVIFLAQSGNTVFSDYFIRLFKTERLRTTHFIFRSMKKKTGNISVHTSLYRGEKYTDYGNFWLFIVWRWEIFFLYTHTTVSFLFAAHKFSKSTIFLLAVLHLIFFFIKRLNFQTTFWIILSVRVLYNTPTYHKSKSNARKAHRRCRTTTNAYKVDFFVRSEKNAHGRG